MDSDLIKNENPLMELVEIMVAEIIESIKKDMKPIVEEL